MSVKISELPSANSVGNSDVIPIVQSGTTKKATANLLKTTISSTINSSSTNDTASGSKAVYDYSAPISHSSSATTYGVGTESNYGHCKTINNLTTASYVAGESLSAYQGKVLDDAKENVSNKTNVLDENSTSDQYPNAEVTYTTINNLDTQVNVEIANLQAENDLLLSQIPTNTVTGTSVSVSDSSNMPLKEFELYGNTTQTTSTGINLANKLNSFAGYINGTTIVTGGGNNYSIWIKCKPSTDYTISVNPSSVAREMGYTTVQPANNITAYNVKNMGANTKTYTYTTGADAEYFMFKYYKVNQDGNFLTVNEMLSSLQIEEGSTASPYEPYTNGVVAPSTDLPMPLNNITGNVVMNKQGKNYLKLPNYTGTQNNYSITISNGVITASGTTTAGAYPMFLILSPTKILKYGNWRTSSICPTPLISFKDKTIPHKVSLKNYTGYPIKYTYIFTDTIGYERFYKGGSYTIPAGKDLYAIGITVPENETASGSVEILVEDGETTTDYEAYKDTTTTLELGDIELKSVGEVRDRIYTSNGSVYLEQNIGVIDSYAGETITTAYMSTTGGLDTGATIQYVLTTPVTTEITDSTLLSQIETVLNNGTYRTITNLYPDKDINIGAEYRQDLTTLFNNVTNAIISL